jgi:twitching motility two-component system response regulator PilH
MKKILVVESSPTIKSVADSLLRQKGFDVTCLSDGQRAYEFARSEKPDLILSGLELAGIKGDELCMKITSDPFTGGIPVILFVGKHDTIDNSKIDLCGARGLIKKPFSPKELLSVVEKFTGSGGPIRAPKAVDQSSDSAPKLKPKVSPQEIKTATRSIISEEDAPKKHETVFNLEWSDLSDSTGIKQTFDDKLNDNDSSLVLEEDQFGLTSLADEVVSVSKGNKDEDYDWFINEMKQEMEDFGGDSRAKEPPREPKVAYQDLKKPVSKDDSEYRRFLENFKQEQPSPRPDIDINRLVETVSDKLAQKIVEKIDKNEIKQILTSILKENKFL